MTLGTSLNKIQMVRFYASQMQDMELMRKKEVQKRLILNPSTLPSITFDGMKMDGQRAKRRFAQTAKSLPVGGIENRRELVRSAVEKELNKDQI